MSEYSKDLSTWSSSNIFMDNEKFSSLQTSLVPIRMFHGSYEKYSTSIEPECASQWLNIIIFPGTAFKFSNKLNAEYTARSLLGIFELKNLPARVYVISHRLNPVFPEATSNTIEMLELILNEEKLKCVFILTWSAGCCHLEQAVQVIEKAQAKIAKILMVSPVVDMANTAREKGLDFLNQDFFEFIEKVYCSGDPTKVQQLSLIKLLQKSGDSDFLQSHKLSIIYGSQEYIRKDIEEFISKLDAAKKQKGYEKIETKCFEGQNHALLSFVTSKQTQSNEEAMKKIAGAKWRVSKCIVDYICE